MFVQVGAVPEVPVIPPRNLAAVALLASLGLSQAACHASGRPDEAPGTRANAVRITEPVLPVPSARAAAVRREPHAGNTQGAPRAAPVAMPVPIRGTWQMGDAPCGVPHPDSDGTLTITSEGWQGFEYYGSPEVVQSLSPHEWVIEGEESYQGSQHDQVRKRFTLKEGFLTISEPDYVERYSRCKRG